MFSIADISFLQSNELKGEIWCLVDLLLLFYSIISFVLVILFLNGFTNDNSLYHTKILFFFIFLVDWSLFSPLRFHFLVSVSLIPASLHCSPLIFFCLKLSCTERRSYNNLKVTNCLDSSLSFWLSIMTGQKLRLLTLVKPNISH